MKGKAQRWFLLPCTVISVTTESTKVLVVIRQGLSNTTNNSYKAAVWLRFAGVMKRRGHWDRGHNLADYVISRFEFCLQSLGGSMLIQVFT